MFFRINILVGINLFYGISLAQTDTLKTIEVNTEKKIQPSECYKSIPIQNCEVHLAENLSDLLSKESSIYIKSFGSGGLSTISIRGAGASHTQLYWNGIAINSPTLGQLDLATLPMAFIDEVEIHLGASSVIDGSGGLGGSIQLNNSADYGSRTDIIFRKELGSFGLDNNLFSFNFGNKKLQSKSSVFRNNSINNFEYIDITQSEHPIEKRENSEINQVGIKQEIYFKPKSNHEISFKGNYFDSYRQLAPIIGVAHKGEYQTDKTIRLLGEWNHLHNSSFHHFRLAYIQDLQNYVDTASSIDSRIKVDSYKASYNFKHFFTDSIKLTFQANLGADVANSSGFDTIHIQNRQSIFVQYEQRIKLGLLYNIAFRHETIDYKFTPIIPTIGLLYYLDKKERFSINANVARNFKAPSLNELYWSPGGNPNLLPEIGYTSEFGFRFQFEKLVAEISPYYSIIENWIQWLPTEGGLWSPTNVKKVENKGFEISLDKKYLLKDKLEISFHTNYNFIVSKNKSSTIINDNSIGKQLIYVPLHTFNISANVHLANWKFQYNQTITGKVFVDSYNTTYMPYYAPADLRISYHSKESNRLGEVGLKITNLYDEDYQIIANRPLPGRWYSVFLKVQLKAKNV